MPDGKKILLCACGLTPQVVTETLWTLAVREGAFVPDEVHLVTTLTGRKIALERLLHPDAGRFHALCADYGLAGRIRMDASMIHVIERGGESLEDIRDIADNSAAAAWIFGLVRRLAESSGQIHASLAGGRKTMSFYLGAALQFYARQGDELSHVLVSSPFETHPDFFYPPRSPRDFSFQDRRTGEWLTLSSAEAKIELARLPLLRLRDLLPDKLPVDLPVEDMVAGAQRELAAAGLQREVFWDSDAGIVSVGGDKARLTPMEAAVFDTLVQPRLRCERDECAGCMKCYRAPEEISWEELLDSLGRRYQYGSGRYEDIEARWRKENEPGSGVRAEWLRQQRASINKRLARLAWGSLAEIQSQRAYANTRYGLRVEGVVFRAGAGEERS